MSPAGVMPNFIRTTHLFIFSEEHNEEPVSKHLTPLIFYQISVGSQVISKSEMCDVNLWKPTLHHCHSPAPASNRHTCQTQGDS